MKWFALLVVAVCALGLCAERVYASGEWWRWSTVAVMCIAVLLEGTAAYCDRPDPVNRPLNRNLLGDRFSLFWRRLWTPILRTYVPVRVVEPDGEVTEEKLEGRTESRERMAFLEPALARPLRAVSRFGLAALFIARFAAEQPIVGSLGAAS